MTPPVHAIPLHYGDLAQPNSGVQIGSGFLAEFQDRLFLMSAAHIPFGAPSQTNDWRTWPATVSVHIPGHHVPLDLFDEIDGSREPKFGYHLDPDGVRLIDLMWIPLDQYPDGFVEVLASTYHTFDLNEKISALHGERVTCFGYPSAGPWPFEKPSRAVGALSTADPLRFTASAKIKRGFSGGPVTNTSGQLVGMAFGSDDTESEAIAVIISRNGIVHMMKWAFQRGGLQP